MNKDQASSAKVQSKLTDASYNCTLLKETLGFLQESIVKIKDSWEKFYQICDDNSLELIAQLKINTFINCNNARIQDAQKVIEGVLYEIDGLRDQIDVFNEKRLQSIFQQLKMGTYVQLKTHRAAEHQNSKMKVIEVVLSGSLALSIVEMFVGEYSFVGSTFLYIHNSIMWGIINILIWAGFSVSIWLFMKLLEYKSEKILLIKVLFEQAINLDKLENLLFKYGVYISDVEDIEGKALCTAQFMLKKKDSDLFKNHKIFIQMRYDSINGYLYDVDIEVYNPKYKEQFFKRALVKLLSEANVFRK
ncbi:MAG: hypothetical protein ACTSRA_05575 [Promethearchaeota archaeon]